MVSCFRTGLTCWQPTHRVVLRRAGSKLDVLLYPSETDTDRENQWLICPQENALQMDSDGGFFQILVPVRVGSIHQRAPWLPKQLLGQGCQPRTSVLIWTEVGGWYICHKKNGAGTCWNPHWVSCWTLFSPRNNLEDLQESDAKAPPVPRCMLADDKKKERKKKNSLIMKKCRGAFQNEEKCLEQAVHGNCKWCEGLCGPNEVWGALTWHSSEMFGARSTWQWVAVCWTLLNERIRPIDSPRNG